MGTSEASHHSREWSPRYEKSVYYRSGREDLQSRAQDREQVVRLGPLAWISDSRVHRIGGFLESICFGSSRSTACRWAISRPRSTIRSWLLEPTRRCSRNLREHLREGDDFRIETAASGFEAGIRAESFHPDCIIIDLAVGRIEAGQIAQNLRKSQDHLTTILIALSSDEPTEEVYNLGFNDAFKKPFDGALLAERVRRLISQKKADEP